MPMSSSGAVLGAVLRALVLAVALQVALTAPAHRVLADDLAGAARGEESQATDTLDESGFGFRLRLPDGWSIDIDAEDGPMLSWRMHRAAWLAGSVPEGLLALNVTVIEPERGKDVETEFRKFVGNYADRFLEDGEVVSFSAFFFGAYPGFLAAVDGGISQDSGAVVKVSARVFIYETEDRQVIVSAVAPRSSAAPLDHLGEPGSLIEASGGGGTIATEAGTAQADAPAPSPVATAPVVIIPDTSHRLRAVSWGGGSLDEFGRLDADGLTVALPAGARTGGVGVASSGSPVALGDLDGGDATIMRMALDPTGTDSVMVVLCPGQMVPCISEPSLLIQVAASDTGAKLSLWTEGLLVATENLPDGVPEHVTVRIDRDGVFVFPAGGEAMLAERPRSLVPFAGLDVVIAALPTEAGGRLHMTALSVEMDRQAEMAMPPAPNTAAAIFPPKESDGWREEVSSGGDFAAFAALGADGLAVSVPAGHSWGVTGLVSARPILGLPDGNDTPAPERLRGTVDPAVSDSFAVAILPDAEGDVWLSAIGYVDVHRVEDGRFRARIYTCGSATRIAETFIAGTWSGVFDLIVRPDRLELALDGRHLSATTLTCLPPEAGTHVAVFAVAAQESDPASLRLTGLSTDRLPLPASVEAGPGPDAEFRPEDWIADMANELSEIDQ